MRTSTIHQANIRHGLGAILASTLLIASVVVLPTQLQPVGADADYGWLKAPARFTETR